MSRATQPATVLGEGARVEGDLQVRHDAVIAGEVAGDVRAGGVVELADTARVGGNVYADTVRLAGRVGGAVVAREHTELRAGAWIGGGLTTARLSVAEGVSYDGPLRLGVAAPPEKGYGVGSMGVEPSAEAKPHVPVAKQTGTDGAFTTVPGAANAVVRPRRRVVPPRTMA